MKMNTVFSSYLSFILNLLLFDRILFPHGIKYPATNIFTGFLDSAMGFFLLVLGANRKRITSHHIGTARNSQSAKPNVFL